MTDRKQDILTHRRRIKLSLILALPIFMPLVWVLALSDAATPLVQTAGVYGCIVYAAVTALVTAWMIVSFIMELRKQ